MLVLARKIGETIVIGDDVRITIIQIGRGRVQIGIDAPREVAVRRQELSPVERELQGVTLPLRLRDSCDIGVN